MVNHVRWYVNISRWKPTREEWLSLTSSISEDELVRINKFVYQEDSKASLIGRALIRNFISKSTGRPSDEAKLIRTQLGRPEVCDSYKKKLGNSWPIIHDFNVSHSGDYCVLVGSWSKQKDDGYLSVGVDVTKIVSKSSKQELDRFLDLMSRREFTSREWETVTRVNDERQKCINFTRLWCLKESFIKSIGLGLKFGLCRISFDPADHCRYNLDPCSLMERFISDTRVMVDNELDHKWKFFETALDNEHLIAIGYKYEDKIHTIEESPFEAVSISELIDNLTPIAEGDESNWIKFSSSSTKLSR